MEESSQDEVRPSTVSDLEQLLLGEGYLRTDCIYPYLELLTDNVQNAYSDNESHVTVLQQGLPVFTWDVDMFDKMEELYTTGIDTWEKLYSKIKGCNVVLDMLDDVTGDENEKLNQRGQALALRGYYYFLLINTFAQPYNKEGIDLNTALGVPLIVSSAVKDEYPARESIAKVYQQIERDLLEAVDLMDKYGQNNIQYKVTPLFVYNLLSRMYLYMENWGKAAEYAEAVISSEIYKLYPKYGDLFLVSGLTDANNKEIILKAEFSAEIPLYHKLPLHMQSRNLNGYSTMVPTQNLIDSYHCIDGKNIAESPLFNKKKPFENRDPRLRLGFVVPGDRYGDFIFESHVDSTSCWSYAENGKVTNKDCYSFSPYTSYTGYCTRKFSDPSYADKNEKGDYPLILCRYAEVLLTYAEAKIEANDIDKSVVDALNEVRNGRDDVKMPALSLSDLSDQSKARVIVRHERKVELAFEGFRYFDIRRWDGFWKYANRPVMGRPFKGKFEDWPNVTFDENDEPVYDYDAYMPHPSSDYRLVENRTFVQQKHELWPIPQRERNVSPQLTQNPGF